jgi:hypothetical protein
MRGNLGEWFANEISDDNVASLKVSLLARDHEISKLKDRLAEFTKIYDFDMATYGAVKRAAAIYAKCCKPSDVDPTLWGQSKEKQYIIKGYIAGAKAAYGFNKRELKKLPSISVEENEYTFDGNGNLAKEKMK